MISDTILTFLRVVSSLGSRNVNDVSAAPVPSLKAAVGDAQYIVRRYCQVCVMDTEPMNNAVLNSKANDRGSATV